MEKTITITHHAEKPEYQWEIVVPEGPTVLLSDGNLDRALEILGVAGDARLREELSSLPNGGSRSIEADLTEADARRLSGLGV